MTKHKRRDLLEEIDFMSPEELYAARRRYYIKSYLRVVAGMLLVVFGVFALILVGRL